MKLLTAAILATLASTANAQTPAVRHTVDNQCWFDDLSVYRVTYTLHSLQYNPQTDLWYVASGCGQLGVEDNQITVNFRAAIEGDCLTVNFVPFVNEQVGFWPAGWSDCAPLSPPQPIAGFDLDRLDIGSIRTNGVRGGPSGVVVPGGGVCAAIAYRIEYIGAYDYKVYATAQSAKTDGCGNENVEVLVEHGQLITDIPGNNCADCLALIPDPPDPDPPPPPPPPPGPGGGGGDEGETGPDYPGGPNNPEGQVCCHFIDGSIVMSYADCIANEDAQSWSESPCDLEVIGCCTFFDYSIGPLGMEIRIVATETTCSILEGVWTPGPCDTDDCAECCEAIRAILESFTGDIQVPLRNWLLEDWPDFSDRVLAVLEQSNEPEPEPEGVDPAEVGEVTGTAGEYFDGVTVPGDNTSGTNWTFDVLGTQQTFNLTFDPRNWPADPMHNTLATLILLIRGALAIGLTIMFGTMVGKVLRQW